MTTPTDPETPKPPRVMLSADEAAERLSISRSRVFGLIKSGEIDSVMVGRLRRVPADALAAYIAGLRASQKNPTTGNAA